MTNTIQLKNRFYSLLFDNGLWSGLYDKSFAPQINIIQECCHEPLMLRGKSTAKLQTVTNYGSPGVQSKNYDISSGSYWFTDDDPWQFIKTESNASSLSLYYKNKLFSLKVNYFLHDNMAVIERSFELEYHGNEDLYLHEAILTTPMFCNGTHDDDIWAEIYDTRNNLGNLRHRLGNIQPLRDDCIPSRDHCLTAMDRDIHHEVSALMVNHSVNTSLAIWGYSDQQEAVSYVTKESTKGLRFDQGFYAFARLSENRQIQCGKQLISTYKSSNWQEAISGVVRLKDLGGFIAPSLPDKLKTGMIYQVHGFVADFGGFEGLRTRLDVLKELGVKIIYIQPLSGPEAYLNTMPDQISSCFGTEEELRQLSKEAHARDMYVIVDMIAHHLFKYGPPAQKPEFIRYDELGKPLSYSIGSVLTETSNKEYQQYYIECCRRLRKECLIDGFRFDVAGFQLPNWSKIHNPGYKRPGQGVLAQNKLLMKIYQELGKDTIILEEGMGVTGFRYITHGWIQMIKRLRDDSRRKFEPLGLLLEKIKIMLSDRALKERINVSSMLHVKIHDTALTQNFGTAINGIDLPLTILAISSDCVPLITQGMERGYFDMIKNLNFLCRECPEMISSSMNFDDVICENENIFAFSRECSGKKSIVIINFSNQEQKLFQVKCKGFEGKTVFKNRSSIASKWNTGSCLITLAPYAAIIFRNQPLVIQKAIKTMPVKNKQKIVAKKSINTLAVNIKNWPDMTLSLKFIHYNNDIEAGQKISGNIAPDEGSATGHFEKSDKSNIKHDMPIGDKWHSQSNGFEHWPSVFVPTTRIPYLCNEHGCDSRYIEDIIDGEHNLLFTRDLRIRSGKCFFRKTFNCQKKPVRAVLQFCSPACYDFDLSVDNHGVSNDLRTMTNQCSVYINESKELCSNNYPGTEFDVTEYIRAGKNIIGVVASRGNGAHGIVGKLTIHYNDDSVEIIPSDASWQYFPGTVFVPKIIDSMYIENSTHYNFILNSLENTVLSENKSYSGILVQQNDHTGNSLLNISLNTNDKQLLPIWTLTTCQAGNWFARNDDYSFLEALDKWGEIRNAYSGALLPVWQDKLFNSDGFTFGVMNEGRDELSIETEKDSVNSIFHIDSISNIEVRASNSLLIHERSKHNFSDNNFKKILRNNKKTKKYEKNAYKISDKE